MATATGTFTYALTSSLSALEQVRLQLGDTDSEHVILWDEEINHKLTLHADNVTRASLACARLCIGKFVRETDENGAGIQANRSQKIQHMKDLIKELTAIVASGAEPITEGDSKSREADLRSDDDWKGPQFQVGMDDYPGTGGRANDPNDC